MDSKENKLTPEEQALYDRAMYRGKQLGHEAGRDHLQAALAGSPNTLVSRLCRDWVKDLPPDEQHQKLSEVLCMLEHAASDPPVSKEHMTCNQLLRQLDITAMSLRNLIMGLHIHHRPDATAQDVLDGLMDQLRLHQQRRPSPEVMGLMTGFVSGIMESVAPGLRSAYAEFTAPNWKDGVDMDFLIVTLVLVSVMAVCLGLHQVVAAEGIKELLVYVTGISFVYAMLFFYCIFEGIPESREKQRQWEALPELKEDV